MFSSLLLLILEAVVGFFTLALLGRFYMQWSRVSFRNQIGQFLVALTDWIVIPVRRVVPGLFGLDLASVVLAWLAQTLLLTAELWLRGAAILGAGALPALLVLGLFEVARVMIYLLIGVVIIAAILSWVNPYSPVAPLLHSLSRPFLRPVQRIVPPIANIDLSPLVALLVFQIALMLLASLRASILPVMAE